MHVGGVVLVLVRRELVAYHPSYLISTRRSPTTANSVIPWSVPGKILVVTCFPSFRSCASAAIVGPGGASISSPATIHRIGILSDGNVETES